MNHLNDSERWTSNGSRRAEFTEELQRFEQCMRHLFVLYTFAMRQLPSDNIVPLAAHLELRKAFRMTVYHLRHYHRRDEFTVQPFRLYKRYVRLLDHEDVAKARKWMGGVLLHKQCLLRNVELPLNASSNPYSSAHDMGRNALSSALDISTKWIVDWSTIMPLEL
jgi:hypothetical protein